MDDYENLPRSNNTITLCMGESVTECCGAFATFHDDILCCKVCWREVGEY